MITLAVDGRGLWDGSQTRGIGVYLTQLVKGLRTHADIRTVVLARPGTGLPAGAELRPVRRSTNRRLADLEHELLLPRELTAVGADVGHGPGQHPPRRAPVPWLQNVHDLTPLTYDDPTYAGDRRRWRRMAPRLRRAAGVITGSRFSAGQVHTLLGIPTDRIHVIAHAAGSAFRPTGEAPAEPPYLLYVGAWGPHKGFAEAFAVVGRLADLGYPHSLKVAGHQDTWMRARVEELRARSPRPERVEILGYVDDLAALYRRATALVVSSRAEGFGLPAVEAMACGTPVVAFANTALTEVVDEGGVLVDDGDVDAFVAALRRVLDSERERLELSQRALARARSFSWERAVAAHADLYRATASSR
jgi:glycosyltransferase involved in cell wall biosynthesis